MKTMTMKMILMTMKMATIAKLDSGRRFKAVQCPLQPDKDSKLRSNKDEDDCDKCFSCCPRKTLLEPSVQARISHNQFISLCVKAPCWSQEKYKHCQRHNGPRILSPKLELSLKAETNANSNLAL